MADMVIDFHTHCFTDSLAQKAISKLEAGCDIHAVHDGTAEGLKKHMAQCGVSMSVVSPVATKPTQVDNINEWAGLTADKQLLFFGAAHPDDARFFDVLTELKNAGFKGIKLHPDYQGFYADETRMLPLYEAIRDIGLIVLIHAGVDLGYPSPVHCTPLMLKKITESVKGLKLVAAHMGGHALWRDVEELLCGLPIILDTSFSYYALGKENMARMIRKHGAGNVVFGTDSPWMRAGDEIRNIHSLGLSPRDTDKILWKNAQELLGLG